MFRDGGTFVVIVHFKGISISFPFVRNALNKIMLKMYNRRFNRMVESNIF